MMGYRGGRPASPSGGVRRGRSRSRPAAAVAAVAALLLAGCTSPEPPDVAPSPSATTPETPPASVSPPAPEPITFAYEVPDRPCPPASTLPGLPHADEYPYRPVNAYIEDNGDYTYQVCTYRREDIDVGDRVVEDYANVGGKVWLWRDIADLPRLGTAQNRLPVESADLADWAAVSHTEDRGVIFEVCGPDGTECADGEEPTVRVHAWRTELRGVVGNLEFNLWATYRSADPPPDVELRTVALLRSRVMAEVERRERVE